MIGAGILERCLDGANLIRRQAYSRGLLLEHGVTVPVISVGGPGLGGSGKTPVTGMLARRLAPRVERMAVVMSGYGGKGRGDGQPSVVEASARWDRGELVRHGDEALLMAGWLPGVMIVAGRDKLQGARLAARRGAQLILVDDGYSHRRLVRDLDIVLLPGHRRQMLPPSRGCLTWHHIRNGEHPMTASTETSQVCSFLRPVDLLAMDGTVRASAADLHGVKVFLACGIARPGDFEALVKSLGARVVGRQFIQDHRPLPESALKRAARAGAELVLSSEKDAARMVGLVPWRHLLALRCEVRICAGEALLDAALARALNRCG